MRKYLILGLILIIPSIAIAQNAGNDVWTLWDYFFRVMKDLVVLCWVVTVMTFLYGIVEFLRNVDDPKTHENGKKLMIGSVIAFIIALSFWALVTFVIEATQQTVDSPYEISTVSSKN